MDKLEIIEQRLKELHAQIEKMELENAQLFADLGIGPHQLQELLSDPSHYSLDAFEFIQRERRVLQEILDKRMLESRKKLEADKPRVAVGGHWILMR
jgi:hypothetical protein